MKYSRISHRVTLVAEIVLTITICVGMIWGSFTGTMAESRNYTAEVTADYNTLVNDYTRSFKILRMEAETEIAKDLSFDEMQEWLQSRDAAFADAIGENIYDGFAFTYKGGYAHSWNYGDYSQYVPASRPWYQAAEAAGGEVAIVAPYVTFLSNTDYIESYDILRLSVVQRYNDEISFDFDLDVKEINALIADRSTIYQGTSAFLYDADGYILSASDSGYYGHNINTADTQMSQELCDTLRSQASANAGTVLRPVDGQLRFTYSTVDADGKTVCLLIPFGEVFVRNYLFVLLLGIGLLIVEVLIYRNNKAHFKMLEANERALADALHQAEDASQAKGAFMSRMSHEIRTPLNAVVGYLEIAKDEPGNPEKTDDCIGKSQLASRHLLSIINDVLDISSIESGRMKLSHDDFDIKQMVNALTTMFYSSARNKGVDFQVHMDALESEWLVGDELRVRQILMNLLSNAVKFTPRDGSVTLGIKQVPIDQERIHLEFTVSDTGIGMSEEYQQRMFTPFEQESSSTARNFGGTGLGLSISNNLVRMMGGSIRVDSKQGEGTTFTVLLAFDAAEGGDEMHASTDSFAKLRALVVDDEEGTCDYARKLLARCGVKCDAVNSGKKAVLRVQTRQEQGHPYDLCIIDWHMKGMDGLTTAREVRRICGDTVPIIIATAYDYSDIIDDARDVGVNKIVSKPLFQSTLMNLLVNTYGKYEPAKPKVHTTRDFTGFHLLLAEDNTMNMEIATSILQKAGFTVTPVTNGQEALEAFEASEPGTFDAILMDVQMPILDGYAATREIRKSSHAQAKSIPVIAMTANAFSEDVSAALAAGMNDHVAKPISYDRLYDALDRLIGD